MAGRYLSLVALVCTACATTRTAERPSAPAQQPAAARAATDPFPSTYEPLPARPTLIRNATILTATGPRLQNGAILLRDGKIAAVGATVDAPADAVVIDARGKWVTPGIIDTHSHLGVYSAPAIASLQDGNEMTNPVTAQVWAEHSVWPQDPQFALALAGGITAMQILPGSGNLIGGRSVTVKNVPARTVQGMKFPGAPHGLKMACGENPKRVYGGRTTTPSTSMGNVAGFRAAWIRAEKYRADWDRWQCSRCGCHAPPRPRPAAGNAGRRAARRYPGAQPLLSRR